MSGTGVGSGVGVGSGSGESGEGTVRKWPGTTVRLPAASAVMIT